MSLEGDGLLTQGRLPRLHRAVLAADRQPRPVRTPADAVDSVAVAAQRAQLLAGAGVPHSDQPVQVRCRQAQAIRAEAQTLDAAVRDGEREDLFALDHIPDPR